jgi:hypothetical protein
MQDDQAILFFGIFGCVRHCRSGPGGSGFSFSEFGQVGPDGLRLREGEVPEKGRRVGTVGRGNQSLKRLFSLSEKIQRSATQDRGYRRRFFSHSLKFC